MRYYKFFAVETGSSTNTVELNITFVVLRMKISILCTYYTTHTYRRRGFIQFTYIKEQRGI